MARPYLEKLAAHTDATALLSRIEGNSVVVIDQSTAMCGGIYVTTEIGTLLPLHATSQGKLLLAAMSDASAKAFLSGAGQLESFTPHTIVEQESILRELGQIRANGYAVENGEYKIGLRSVSAPVYDRCGVMSYALSVVGLFRKVRSQKFEEAVACVSATAAVGGHRLPRLPHAAARKGTETMTTRTRITALLLADVNQDGLRNAQDLQRLYEQLTGTA